MLNHETRIFHAIFAAQSFEVTLPTLAVGRVGEHEVELARGESVVGERGVFRPTHNVVRCLALALQQKVGFSDGIGLGIDLLAVEVRSDLLAMFFGQLL